MRLRCPHNGCSIEVADDMVGARIRCPHCEQLLFVDRQYEEGAAEPLGAEIPTLAPDSEQKPQSSEPARPEARLYAGMPPLALMLAIREGRGSAWDAGAIRAEMTDDDWKALALFEKVLWATASLTTSLWFGITVLVFTALLWMVTAGASTSTIVPAADRVSSQIATLVLLSLGFIVMGLSRTRIKCLQMGAAVDLAAWAALGVALVFAVNVVLALVLLSDDRRDPALVYFGWIASPFHLIAAIVAGKTSVLVHRSLAQTGPPEILQRLTAALKYLE
jgi:hypothetical protein